MRQSARLAEEDKSQQVGQPDVSQSQPTFGRYTEIPYDQMTMEQQDAYRSLIDAEGLEQGSALPGPLKIWVINARLSKAVASVTRHFRPSHHSLTQRERELAVCIINSKWHAPYSIDAHETFAKNFGMPPR